MNGGEGEAGGNLGELAAVLWVQAILIRQKWVLDQSASKILQLIVAK